MRYIHESCMLLSGCNLIAHDQRQYLLHTICNNEKTQDHSAISEELPESCQFLYQICFLWLQINWTAEHKDVELSVYISCTPCWLVWLQLDWYWWVLQVKNHHSPLAQKILWYPETHSVLVLILIHSPRHQSWASVPAGSAFQLTVAAIQVLQHFQVPISMMFLQLLYSFSSLFLATLTAGPLGWDCYHETVFSGLNVYKIYSGFQKHFTTDVWDCRRNS